MLPTQRVHPATSYFLALLSNDDSRQGHVGLFWRTQKTALHAGDCCRKDGGSLESLSDQSIRVGPQSCDCGWRCPHAQLFAGVLHNLRYGAAQCQAYMDLLSDVHVQAHL